MKVVDLDAESDGVPAAAEEAPTKQGTFAEMLPVVILNSSRKAQ